MTEPLQERALIAVNRAPFIRVAALRPTISTVARHRTSQWRRQAKVALAVESIPTAFIRAARTGRAGDRPLTFDCRLCNVTTAATSCRSYDEIRAPDEIWPEVVAFIRSGRFTDDEQNATGWRSPQGRS
jgi:hypothetical protein